MCAESPAKKKHEVWTHDWKELAEADVPVLCTVHQPSSEIFAKFDDARNLEGLPSKLAESNLEFRFRL